MDLMSMLSSLQGLSEQYVQKKEETKMMQLPEAKVRSTSLYNCYEVDRLARALRCQLLPCAVCEEGVIGCLDAHVWCGPACVMSTSTSPACVIR